MRLVDESAAEEDELQQRVEAGSADIDAGRYRTVATSADERQLQAEIMARLQSRLSAEE
jgi:hypothetical protein